MKNYTYKLFVKFYLKQLEADLHEESCNPKQPDLVSSRFISALRKSYHSKALYQYLKRHNYTDFLTLIYEAFFDREIDDDGLKVYSQLIENEGGEF